MSELILTEVFFVRLEVLFGALYLCFVRSDLCFVLRNHRRALAVYYVKKELILVLPEAGLVSLELAGVSPDVLFVLLDIDW